MTKHDRQTAIHPHYKHDGQDRLLPRISLWLFDHARLAASLWIILALFGIITYTTLLKREGFPSVNIPFTLVSGTYLVNDAERVDREVARPISDLLLEDERVTSVQASSRSIFYTVVAQFQEGTDVEAVARELNATISRQASLPAQATVKAEAPKFGFTERGDDAVLTVYSRQSEFSSRSLSTEAESLVADIKARNLPSVESVSLIDPFTTGVDPRSGRQVATQSSFDRYGVRQDGQNQFYRSVAVGLMQKDGSDIIDLDKELQSVVSDFNARQGTSGIQAVVSGSFADDIRDQIGELQKALLEGLLAVLIVGSLIIAVRASFITVLSMLTVLAITAGVLFLTGYSLNTITLFALILCLGLIVDDTIIMVEAIDAQRRRLRNAREIIRVATRKVSRAMVAATLTAALSFAPLLFVGGILGGFIRAIPVTVITSLLVSLAVALVFIPLFARWLLLGKKQLGAANVHEPAAKTEARIASFIARPMVWAQHSRKRLLSLGVGALLVGFLFVGAGGFLFQKVTFNIFPPSKDTNGLIVQLRFPPGADIAAAQAAADRAQGLVAEKLGPNFKSASYYANANEQTATLNVDLIPYDKRDVTAPQLETELNQAFQGFAGAQVKVNLADIGPPASAFNVRIVSDDRQAATRLADDVAEFLRDTQLTRPSGEVARVNEVNVADPAVYSRADSRQYIAVTANFDAKDTTTLVTLAQDALRAEFDAERLRQYDLPVEALSFDLGQEQENQDSFKSLAIAFPILLVVIFLLLAVQFRSLLQPLLIFLAIPFSLFGITLGLYLSDNSFSFFAALGFFALIGLSIKNTILLTDYANQLRREGANPVDAAVGALGERFRPLIATSLTAVVSLIPLAITSPFWEGLAIVLIGGLLSSTLLVITVFPYYYLGAEYLRGHIRFRRRKTAGK